MPHYDEQISDCLATRLLRRSSYSCDSSYGPLQQHPCFHPHESWAHGPTEELSTSSGVLQGDTLAPLLFIVVMDYVLRRCLQDDDSFVLTHRRSSRHPPIFLPALAYADDVALLCRDPAAAQRVLTRLCNEGQRVGLLVNARKTEVLHIGFANPPVLTLPSGEALAVCQDSATSVAYSCLQTTS